MTERTALDALFAPSSVAVIGASRSGDKKGNAILRNLVSTYRGDIHVIHPSADRIEGLVAHRSLGALPGPVELLVTLVPARELIELIRHAPAGIAKVLLSIPSGFGEVGTGGEAMEAELVAVSRAQGMRVVGPNTLGVVSPGLGLNASLAPPLPVGKGGLSVVTQSGGFGMALYMYALEHGLGVARFCDLGNTSDVSIAEVVSFYVQDPDTTVVGGFLESHPEGVATWLAEAAAEKPVLLTALGRTAEGRRTASSHLGPSPGRSVVVPPQGSRVIRARTGLEMLDIAKAMCWQPLPTGPRVGVITGSGGIATELVDLCVEHGLEVPVLSPGLRGRLKPHLPSYASVSNPVDLTPIWPEYPDIYPPLMDALLDSDEIDLLVVTVIDMATALSDLMPAIVGSVRRHADTGMRPKPVLVLWVAPPQWASNRAALEGAGLPCYSSTLTVARVAAALAGRAGGATSREGA